MERKLLYEAASHIARAHGVVAFTGAGVSEESGISTFRDQGGIWDRYSPERFGRVSGLRAEVLRHPEEVAGFIRGLLQSCLEAVPNPAHLALARWEVQGVVRAVVTQNIDTLHERAGSKKVIKLHGSINRLRCEACGFRQGLDESQLQQWIARLSREGVDRRQARRLLQETFPACPYCGGKRRPDVVLFEDLLPQEAWLEAQQEASRCHILLVIGTSGLVYPAAEIPLLAKRSGATLIEINPQPTSLTSHADLFLAGKAGQVMEELMQQVHLAKDD